MVAELGDRLDHSGRQELGATEVDSEARDGDLESGLEEGYEYETHPLAHSRRPRVGEEREKGYELEASTIKKI